MVRASFNRSATKYQLTAEDFKQLMTDKVQVTELEVTVHETTDAKGNKVQRKHSVYKTEADYDPPYVVEALVSNKHYRGVMQMLSDHELVYDVAVQKTARHGYRIRAKFCHPDMYLDPIVDETEQLVESDWEDEYYE